MSESTSAFASKIGTVGVLLGGNSRERRISIRSGNAIYQALKASGFDVLKVDTANGFQKQLSEKRFSFAFVALHGEGGEDGRIQRILRVSRIPFVGSDEKSSSRAFDKLIAKRIFQRHSIPTPKYDVLTRANVDRVMKRWDPPYVVKPLREGSSIDILMMDQPTRASSGQIQLLLKRHRRLLIEDKIKGREFTVAIMGGRSLPVIEIRPKRHFYDFKAKYTKGLTNYLVPAPIPASLERQLRSIALRANSCLGLSVMARVDLMVDQHGSPFVLEVNSIPGFTETSLLPKAAKEIGIDFNELCVKSIAIIANCVNVIAFPTLPVSDAPRMLTKVKIRDEANSACLLGLHRNDENRLLED